MRKFILILAILCQVLPAAAAYHGITVANGSIGIMPWNEPLKVSQVLLSNVYDSAGKDGVSRMVRGINPFTPVLEIDGSVPRTTGFVQDIDMRRAVLSSSFQVPGKARVRYDVRALRHLAFTGMMDILIIADADIDVRLSLNPMDVPGEYASSATAVIDRNIERTKVKFLRCSALTAHRGVRVYATAAFVPAEGEVSGDLTSVSVRLRKGQVFRTALVGSICSNADFSDPENESEREVIMVCHTGPDAAVKAHERLWEELWKGDIIIEGDDEAQRAVTMALYHLYSFCREGSRQSIPPFGLSHQGYNGHIFWDTEMWMYPPMLFLNGGIAESMMDYRIDRLPAARRKAMAYGWKGAMFPWESDASGDEACPPFALTGILEQHITADIAIAAWNYYRMTGDKGWLREEGWALLREAAEFCADRAERNDDGSWSIRDVVGADEYASGVDDNAFTNGSAICALRAAVKAAAVLGLEAPERWSEVAGGLRILKAPDGTTLEYEGYDGRRVKQADVNLLAYPLALVQGDEAVRRDLEYYEPRLDPTGPAMSYAILALQHARLGNGDKAYALFNKSYKSHLRPPFGVLAETSVGKACYFATGAGGLLQAVINGFCGLELTDEGVVQLPSALPPHWKSVTVTGVGPERKTYRKVQ